MRRVVVMGVSGCGKTSVGQALAARLGIGFVDADDLHPPGNVAKMRAGLSLTDADRGPWLDRVADRLRHDGPVVVACSALRRMYRDRIRAGAGGPVIFVHLDGEREVIAARMTARQGHFMPPSLLDSQFATLEPPGRDEALIVSIADPVDRIVCRILRALE